MRRRIRRLEGRLGEGRESPKGGKGRSGGGSERRERPRSKRPRGRQPGAPGHGRTGRPLLEEHTDETVRPPPFVEGLWEDDDGLVWTIVQDADSNWEPSPRANEHRPLERQEWERLHDWVIEVVDPGSGRVLASRRARETLWYRPPSRILVSPVDTITTIVAYDVWKPTLQQRRWAA